LHSTKHTHVQLPNSSSRGQPALPFEILRKLEDANVDISGLMDMNNAELGQLVRNQKYASQLRQCLDWFPKLRIDMRLLPITRTVIRLEIAVVPDFVWNDRFHGGAEGFWFWVEDEESTENYAAEYWVLNKKQRNETARISFVFPVSDPLRARLYLRVVSDRWIGSEQYLPVSFRQLVLPELVSPHTDLLDLSPLPNAVLRNKLYEEPYAGKFSYFNPIQTQVFHSLYHTSQNILLGAPTGSGKTVCADMAMFNCFNTYPDAKVVYITRTRSRLANQIVPITWQVPRRVDW
jgi:hypothetical protein